jgi:hypothetical protein
MTSPWSSVIHEAEEWIRDFVGQPHRDLGRRGPVCPFVPAALAKGRIDYRVRADLSDGSIAVLTQGLTAEITDFATDSDTTGPLDARLILLPGALATAWSRLDEAYGAVLKDLAVDMGVMVGQFHPDCNEGSVHNDAFRTSRSPVAMLAIRRMAVHDILFLQDEARWVAVYARRFGPGCVGGDTGDSLVADLRRELFSSSPLGVGRER